MRNSIAFKVFAITAITVANSRGVGGGQTFLLVSQYLI
jgi:hypothetical protein